MQKFIAGILGLATLVVGSLSAASVYVTTLSDENDGCGVGQCSLREAISSAASGDSIHFSVSGTITLSSQIVIDKNLAILGSGASAVKISGGNTTPIFNVSTSDYVEISGMTLQDANNSTIGGALLVDNTSGNVRAINVHFENNHASSGGAVYNKGTFWAESSTFSGNDASFGGAITSSYTGNMTLNASSFSNNSAIYEGGALSLSTYALNSESEGGDVNITDTVFSNNQAYDESNNNGKGGALFINCEDYVFVSINNTTFESNSADLGGGALYAGGSFSMNHSLIHASSTTYGTGNGGAIHITNYCNVDSNHYEIKNSTISENNASYHSGGIYAVMGSHDLNLSNVTLANNIATAQGVSSGGLHLQSGTVRLKNTILSDNEPYDCFKNASGTSGESLGYNIVLDPYRTCDFFTQTGDMNATDPLLLPLADNGGNTLTHALDANSDAIDNGSCTDINGVSVDDDQRGVKRSDGKCDIGAFESGSATSSSFLSSIYYLLF